MKEKQSDIPFALYRLPGEKELHSVEGGSYDGVRLSYAGLEATSWLGLSHDSMAVCRHATAFSDYSEAIGRVTARLRREGGKSVICRQICGLFSRFDPVAMAREYFEMFPDMFCFLFYHPSTGYWMGASPELLLTVDSEGKTARTRALAGTRPSSTEGEWDKKNLEEHAMVVEDIVGRVELLGDGYAAEAGTTGTLGYGAIEHLATPITIFRSAGIEARRVVDAIHPTAAVAGMPLDKALADISENEDNPRFFYAGTLVSGATAYVVLRCVHFDADNWCIYTGSGITALSDAGDEWAETEAKARPLETLLRRY